eukprot:gene2434-3004_t
MASGRILDLLQLQNLTKRDPGGYKDEFQLQYNHYLTQLQIFQLKPTKDYKHFSQLVSYLSHVAMCYPKEMSDFPKQISDLLENNCNNLEPELRRILAKCLILLRNRNLIPQTTLLSLFFKLFRVHDKPLRKLLYTHIVSDIKNTNLKQKNQKLNKSLQNFMYTMLNDSSEIASKMSLKVMVELFRKKIWHDAKTVNVIKDGLFSKNSKIIITTLNFFLHIDNPDKVDSDDEEEAGKETRAKEKFRKMSLSNRVGKKTKGRKTRLSKSKMDLKKVRQEEENKTQPNFPAIELIHDPQGYCDKIFNMLVKTTEKFETRVMMMNFISRLIYTHKLIVFNFYPFIQKYLQPHQKNITNLLAILAQSCHDLVDPDILKPLVMTVAKYFVNDGCNPEVIAIGLNTIRNIVTRCPLSMDKVLLQDLIQYQDKKEKGVKMASKSLLQFFRDNYPSLLSKKDRGRNKTDIKPLEYGHQQVNEGVDGIELLYDEELNRKLDRMEADNGEWEEVDENDEDDEDSDDEEEEVEQEEQEEEQEEEEVEEAPKKKQSKKKETDEMDDIKILTDAEIERIRKLKALKAELDSNIKKKTDITMEEEKDGENDFSNGFITPESLMGEHKKKRQSYEERMESIREGRQGRDPYKSSKARKDKVGKSIRNELKAKLSKPYMLMRQAPQVRNKQFMSLRDKQMNRNVSIVEKQKKKNR